MSWNYNQSLFNYRPQYSEPKGYWVEAWPFRAEPKAPGNFTIPLKDRVRIDVYENQVLVRTYMNCTLSEVLAEIRNQCLQDAKKREVRTSEEERIIIH